jgi:hypothetical protein
MQAICGNGNGKRKIELYLKTSPTWRPAFEIPPPPNPWNFN